MSGEKNLIPMNKRTVEEQKRITTMGGKASGEARRKKRDLKNIVNLMMNADLTDEQKKKVGKMCPDVPEDAMTVNAYVVAGQIKSAHEGNTKAFQALAEYQNQAQKDVKEESYRALKEEISTLELKIDGFLQKVLECTTFKSEREFNLPAVQKF